MKKISLKFMLIFILSLFSSLTYADGVFSRYYNGRFNFVINVPTTKYENSVGGTVNLDFVKNSSLIPTKNLFSAYEAASSDGLTIQDINENIIILAYGSYFLNSEEVNGLSRETIRNSFEYDRLNYNLFLRKYYNGNLPKNIEPLKYDYNKNLFIYGENVAYNTIGKNFYVISYIEENKIVYKKVIYSKDSNAYIVFQASYLPKDKKFMDKLVVEMVNSIRY